MKLIIDALLGGMYLASTESQGNVTQVKESCDTPICFQCIEQIKAYFHEHSFDEVILREDSLIDELMGFSSSEQQTVTTLNW
ncbi:hypothetical protein KIH87_00780 [Paraneptunicella aestuarii]|uniref:DUF6482 family protein n=1 Tax=Paraneptunicella aestuarii TaxID=2831148 RepID=UPI001E5D4B2C|nr:DUF6482 family protein [Paraneptunicella aestuarii]UAA38942.1 hypothetical protein KIH87_00780 [Paraneptunicella aestuarii]